MNEQVLGCSSVGNKSAASGEQESTSQNTGTVVAVRGSVIDAHFPNRLPQINTFLQAGQSRGIAIEVLSQLDEQHIRGIALTGTQGLSRGMHVIATDGPIRAPVGPNILSRMFDVFGNVIDGQKEVTGVEWRSIDRPPWR